jgi:molybdopterin synthase catalytic subunit
MRTIRVQEADFDAGVEQAALAADPEALGAVGAVASFVGYVRGVPAGEAGKVGGGGMAVSPENIAAMTLEHYPGMTEAALTEIVTEAEARWPLLGVTVIHRVGRLSPGAQIVLVAVASAHRGAAFAACEFIMDFLKTRAPFWKREETPQGARWVDAREADDAAAARWAQPGHDAG